MLFTEEQYNKIYEKTYKWLANHSVGSRAYINNLKNYQKELWGPILEVINELSNKPNLNNIEKEFLELVSYTGPIYRIQHYNPKNRGFVFEHSNFQSWSRSLQGVSNISLYGDVVLLVGHAINGINLFGLLIFMFEHNFITNIPPCKEAMGLNKYEKEEEVVFSLEFNHLTDVAVVSKDKLLDWENHKKVIPKEKWRRNSIN